MADDDRPKTGALARLADREQTITSRQAGLDELEARLNAAREALAAQQECITQARENLGPKFEEADMKRAELTDLETRMGETDSQKISAENTFTDYSGRFTRVTQERKDIALRWKQRKEELESEETAEIKTIREDAQKRMKDVKLRYRTQRTQEVKPAKESSDKLAEDLAKIAAKRDDAKGQVTTTTEQLRQMEQSYTRLEQEIGELQEALSGEETAVEAVVEQEEIALFEVLTGGTLSLPAALGYSIDEGPRQITAGEQEPEEEVIQFVDGSNESEVEFDDIDEDDLPAAEVIDSESDTTELPLADAELVGAIPTSEEHDINIADDGSQEPGPMPEPAPKVMRSERDTDPGPLASIPPPPPGHADAQPATVDDIPSTDGEFNAGEETKPKEKGDVTEGLMDSFAPDAEYPEGRPEDYDIPTGNNGGAKPDIVEIEKSERLDADAEFLASLEKIVKGEFFKELLPSDTEMTTSGLVPACLLYDSSAANAFVPRFEYADITKLFTLMLDDVGLLIDAVNMDKSQDKDAKSSYSMQELEEISKTDNNYAQALKRFKSTVTQILNDYNPAVERIFGEYVANGQMDEDIPVDILLNKKRTLVFGPQEAADTLKDFILAKVVSTSQLTRVFSETIDQQVNPDYTDSIDIFALSNALEHVVQYFAGSQGERYRDETRDWVTKIREKYSPDA